MMEEQAGRRARTPNDKCEHPASRGAEFLAALAGSSREARESANCARVQRLRAQVDARRVGDAISSQQTDIFQWIDASGNEQYMWVGDRWQSAPAPLHLKSQDFTFWYPLSFTPDGNVTAMQAVDSFVIDI